MYWRAGYWQAGYWQAGYWGPAGDVAPPTPTPEPSGGWPSAEEILRHRRTQERAQRIAERTPDEQDRRIPVRAIETVRRVARQDYTALRDANIQARESALRAALDARKQRADAERFELYVQFLEAELFRLREEEAVFALLCIAATVH